MTNPQRPQLARVAFILLAALSAAILLVVGGLGIVNHEHFGSERLRHLGLPLLGVMLLASALALRAWWLEVGASRRAQQTLREEADRELAELRDERRELARIRHIRETEQRWLVQLRREVAESRREVGTLGEDDVRSLVLRIAMSILGAEKGLLLAREDGDGDGNLDLARSIGFEHDAHDSVVIQHLASRVLRHDEILHEDDRTAIEGEARTPADAEIENLVAIPVYVAEEFSGVVVCANRQGGFADCEDEVLLALGDHTGAVLQNGRLHADLRTAYLGTVALLSEAIGAKDPLLKGHSEDVASLVASVAHRLGVQPARREELLFGSLLHDIGKLGISERILLKPGALTSEERTAVELHPRIGFRMVQRVPALRGIAPAILHHHERFDGQGYPSGLSGEAIPVEARIVAVADSFSAMTTDRPYRGAMSTEEACEELVRGAGTQWDPEVVAAFVDEVRRRRGEAQKPEPTTLVDAPDDGELDVLREQDGRLLGAGAVELTDPLTLLYSHRYFCEAVAAEAQRAGLQGVGFAVVLGEVADIAVVNREGGFAAGDELLRSAAAVFEQASSGGPGAIAARIGGACLALLAPGATGPEAQARVAERLTDEHGSVQLTSVAWEPGEDGFAVMARAKAGARAVRA